MDKKQQVKDLWQVCFNDDEAFTNLHFDRMYKDENTLTLEHNDHVVSALQMIPYTMTYFGTEISVSYICGACTLPAAQGKGLMQELLRMAFGVMEEREIHITALIPATPSLFDYYRKVGYTEVFDYSIETYVRPQQPIGTTGITVVHSSTLPPEITYSYLDRKLRERVCCILHTYDDFVTNLHSFRLGGGQSLTALDKAGCPIGLLLCEPTEKGIFVRELVYDNDNIKALLLAEATCRYNVTEAGCYVLPSPSTAIPKGMVRIINASPLINPWLHAHPGSLVSANDLGNMEAAALTRRLFDYEEKRAFMSLMLD